MSWTPLEKLKQVYETQRAVAMGHWIEQYVGVAIEHMEKLEKENTELKEREANAAARTLTPLEVAALKSIVAKFND